MRKIVSLLIVVVIVGRLFSCDNNRQVRKLVGTPLRISDSVIISGERDTFNFGSIRAGEMVVKDFVVTNEGTTPFIINKVDSDCGCIVSDYKKRPLIPGESACLSISFDSRGYYGYILKRVSVMTTLHSAPFIFYVETTVE